jgi:hypothetical protein
VVHEATLMERFNPRKLLYFAIIMPETKKKSKAKSTTKTTPKLITKSNRKPTHKSATLTFSSQGVLSWPKYNSYDLKYSFIKDRNNLLYNN